MIAIEKMNWTDLSTGATRRQIDNILAGLYRPVAVLIDGAPVAVLLSLKEYERLTAEVKK